MKKRGVLYLVSILFTAHVFIFPPETSAHPKKTLSQKSAVQKTVPPRKPAVKKKIAPRKRVQPLSSEAELKKRLIKKLSQTFPENEMQKMFSDPRIKLDRTIFKSKPYTCKLPDGKERPYQGLYDPDCGLLSSKSLNAGKEFFELHRNDLEAAYEKYGIDPSIIAATLRIESYFGLSVGDYPIITTLYTLYALPPSPRWRDLALEHIEYFLRLAEKQQWDVFSLKGSSRGAIGIPQFMPFSYWHYAVDGNQDGKTDLFNPVDAIHSVANFYIEHGWSDAPGDIRKAIASYYGRDQDGYVDALLIYARTLKNMMEDPQPASSEKNGDEKINSP